MVVEWVVPQCGFVGQRDDSRPRQDGVGWHKISLCYAECMSLKTYALRWVLDTVVG